MVDGVTRGEEWRVRLLDYRLAGGRYRLQPPDGAGRVYLEVAELWLGVEGERVVCYDAAGRALGDYEVVRREAAARAAAEAQARREAEARAAAEAEARREAEARAAAEAVARREAERARAAAEARLRALEAELRRLHGEA